MRYSGLTQRIAGEGAEAWNIHYRALAYQADGQNITLLSIGDPDFATPPAIVDSAVASLRGGATHYAHIQGKPRLRELIARRHREDSGQPVTAANVAVMAGAQCALYAVAQCILDAGDEVIVPEPMYVTYEAALQASGAALVRVPLRPENDFALRVDDIAAAVTPRTQTLLLNSPHNPTGRMLTREQWADIADLCCRHDLWLISDEVYAQLAFQQAHVFPAALPGMAERTATINSLSKSHAMTGWRLGWVIGPEPLITHLARLALCMLYGSPDFIQDAACTALATSAEPVAHMRETYRQRRDVVCAELADSRELGVVTPAAGMFLMVDIRSTGLSAQAFADRLLDERGISVLAGEAFGPSAAGFIRLSLTVDAEQLAQASRRIRDFARQCRPGNRYALR
jgi:arginine:pyruvate transaminase